MTRRHVFVADLHLDAADAEGLARFPPWLDQVSGPDTALYILGDLFDAWYAVPGDAVPVPPVVTAALANAVGKGTGIVLLPGNRDFLLARWASLANGVRMAGDRLELELGGRRVLTCHGDELCAADWRYQTYKRLIRSRAAYALFRRLSLARRRRLVGAMSTGSELEVRRKPQEVLRPPERVYQRLALAGVDVVVHGHTHRRQRLEISAGERRIEVFSLPGWREEQSWLEYDAAARRWEWREAKRPVERSTGRTM